MGTVYLRGNIWWIKYSDRGRPTLCGKLPLDRGADAVRLLRQREGDPAKDG